MDKNVTVGGQAVIEGVMMRGRKGIATAVRTSNGEIIVDKEETIPYTKKYKILGLPIIRGFVSFIDSLIVGIKTLNYSSSFLRMMRMNLNLINGLKKNLKIRVMI